MPLAPDMERCKEELVSIQGCVARADMLPGAALVVVTGGAGERQRQ